MSSSKKILISGGTGMIGRALSKALVKKGYTLHVLSRSKKENQKNILFFQWDVKQNIAEAEAFKGIDTFIHLAGESIAEGKWSNKKKKRIIDSRVSSAYLAYETFKKVGEFPKKVISASGVGYYGAYTSDQIFSEEDKPAVQDFVSQVCTLWEESVNPFKVHSQVCILRIGVVLAKQGGALPLMAKPIRFFVGSALGSGKQFVPWIHVEDLVGLFGFGVEHSLQGTYNAVASELVNNKQLTNYLAKTLNRPVWPVNVPSWLLKLLLGEKAGIVLEGSRVENQKIKSEGFSFAYSSLDKAIGSIYNLSSG